MTRILVAGVGNIFKGDDGFGVEVLRRLRYCALPDGVEAKDFGIRGIDLAYALLDKYEAVVIVDTAQRGEAPGSLAVIDVMDQKAIGKEPEDDDLSAHDLDPAKALRLARRLGWPCSRVLVVACEPLTFGGEDGALGLSESVAAAIDPAIGVICDLIGALRNEGSKSPRLQELAPADQPNWNWKGEVPWADG